MEKAVKEFNVTGFAVGGNCIVGQCNDGCIRLIADPIALAELGRLLAEYPPGRRASITSKPEDIRLYEEALREERG